MLIIVVNSSFTVYPKFSGYSNFPGDINSWLFVPKGKLYLKRYRGIFLKMSQARRLYDTTFSGVSDYGFFKAGLSKCVWVRQLARPGTFRIFSDSARRPCVALSSLSL